MTKLAALAAAVAGLALVLDETAPEMRDRLAETTIQKLGAARTDLATALAMPDDAAAGEIGTDVAGLIDHLTDGLAQLDAPRNALLERQARAFENLADRLTLAFSLPPVASTPPAAAVPPAPQPDPSSSSSSATSEPSAAA